MRASITFLLLLFCHVLVAQDQNVADSIKLLLLENTNQDSLRLIRLEEIAFYEQDPIIAEEFADKLIESAKLNSSQFYLASGYLQKGNADRLQGNLEQALESFFLSQKIAVQLNDKIKDQYFPIFYGFAVLNESPPF